MNAGQDQFQVLKFTDDPTSSGRVQRYKTRRSHHKTQKGCIVCKRRRIKCDEQKPACQNCVKHGSGSGCSYSTGAAVSPRIRIDQDLRTKVSADWYPAMDSMLFNYFVVRVVETMMPLSSWVTASRTVIAVAVDEPHVMHTILAVSGCHYRYHLKSPRQKCLTEMFHSMQACARLRTCLDVPQIDKVDAVVTTSMLLGSLSFADVTEDLQVPLTQRSVPFFWLGNQRGIGCLLSIFQSQTRKRSIWASLFEEVGGAVSQLDDDRPATEGIPSELAALFDVQETSTCDNHPYLRLLRRLCRLLPIDPGSEMAHLQYMQFVEGMSSQFVALLNALDPKALLLVSYWLSLLSVKDCWWSRLRAENECWAVCQHLERSGDEMMWKYMDFPAAACAYPYISAAPAGQHLVGRLRLDHSRRASLSS